MEFLYYPHGPDDSSFCPKRVAVHIGLPKAGSTFLQHIVFPEIFPEGKCSEKKGMKFENQLRKAWLAGQGRLPFPLASTEAFSANVKYPADSWNYFAVFLEKISEVKPPPAILFVIRKQDSWLKSGYKDNLKKGYPVGSFNDYVNQFRLRDLSWADRIEALRSYPLLVLLHQDLMRYPIESSKLIANFWGRTLSDRSCETILSSSKRANVSPTTELSLRFTRYAIKISKPLRRFIKITTFGMVDPVILRGNNLRDFTAKNINRINAEKVLGEDWIISDSLNSQLDDDWNRAISFVSRPFFLNS